jgi:hypothetical protein
VRVSAVVVVCLVLAVATGLAIATICIVRARRCRRARVPIETRNDAFEVVARAESFAGLSAHLADGDRPSARWASIRAEHAWLSTANRSLRERADGFAFRRATYDLDDALTLLALEISRSESLAAVPDSARRDDKLRFASARLQERSVQLVFSARFMSIVADVEGC